MIKNLWLALLTQRGKVYWKREKRGEGEREREKRKKRGGEDRRGENNQASWSLPVYVHQCALGFVAGVWCPISLGMPFFTKQNQGLSLLESCCEFWSQSQSSPRLVSLCRREKISARHFLFLPSSFIFPDIFMAALLFYPPSFGSLKAFLLSVTSLPPSGDLEALRLPLGALAAVACQAPSPPTPRWFCKYQFLQTVESSGQHSYS